MSSSNNKSSQPRTRGRSIIKGGSGKVLYDSDNDQNKKSSNTIYSGDGKRVLFSSKDKDK